MAGDVDTGIRHGSGSRWLRYAGGAVVGLAFATAVAGTTLLERELRSIMQRDATPWPFWVTIGLYLVLGAGTAAVVLLARRAPSVPAAAAMLLVYGVVQSSFHPWSRFLPDLGPWQPTLHRGLAPVTLLAGAMVAAAAWGWWAGRPSRRHRGRSDRVTQA